MPDDRASSSNEESAGGGKGFDCRRKTDGKGQETQKRRPFLEDDGMEQSEVG